MSDNTRSWLDRLLGRSGEQPAESASPPGTTSDDAEVHCPEVRASASDYIDGESSRSLTQRIKVHLGLCNDCDGWVRTFASTVGLTRELPQEEVPESLREKIKNISSNN